MKNHLAVTILLALLATIGSLCAQDSVTTFAGQRLVNGHSNGPAATATFNDPAALAADAAGNFYIADSQNHVIRKIGTNGIVSTFAGQMAVPGSQDGSGLLAQFDTPCGIAIGPGGDERPVLVVERLGAVVPVGVIRPYGVAVGVVAGPGRPAGGGLRGERADPPRAGAAGRDQADLVVRGRVVFGVGLGEDGLAVAQDLERGP